MEPEFKAFVLKSGVSEIGIDRLSYQEKLIFITN
jgi:hypothetical protein